MRSLRLVVVCAVLSSAAFGQTLTTIDPAYGPTTPMGGNTFTGTGFVTTPKSVRFVDASNNDVFTGASCSSATTCTAYARAGLALPGQIRTIAVYAMVNGVRSAGSRNFIYYGPPVITSVSPNSGPRLSATPLTITGKGFTSAANGLPGTTSIYLLTNINDKTSGCTSSTSCSFTAPAINDCCVSNGVYTFPLITPGGSTTGSFTYAPPAPATPTITALSPSHGPRDGGNTVTVTGTNFSTSANKTSFTINTYGPFGSSTQVFGTCGSTTSCTITMPPGNGRADVRVAVIGGASPFWNSATSANTFADDYTYAGIAVSPGNSVTIYPTEAGGSATFTEVLTKAPSSTVTVTLNASPAGQVSLNPTSLVFTTANWNVPRTVTVTGLDNATVGANSGGSISSMAASSDPHYNGLSGNDQPFQNVDNETAAYAFSQTNLTTTEGGTRTVTVVLSKAPTATVTMSLTNSDTTEGLVSPSALTFATSSGGATGWNVPRTITISGVEDSFEDGDISYPIIVGVTTADAAYGALSAPDLFVTNLDNESTTLFPVAQGDFNGDGKDDILLRDALGNFGIWLMNGAAIASGGFVGSPGDYRVAGVADFNGDGKDDILLRDSGGNVGMWMMNGFAISGGGFVGSLSGATIVGVGDFTGDSKADILTLDLLGNVGMWVMNGSTITSGGLVSALGEYSIVAVRDFNGDARADVLLRDPLGNIGMWIMNGFAITSGALVGSPGGYSVAGAADFNADGRADILLRDPLGNIGMWFMNGSIISSGGAVGSTGSGYRVNSFGDYNADGRADLLLRHEATGDLGIWLMNGTAIVSGAAVGSPGPSYTAF